MSREQIVRDTAYAIWEAEGRPEGRAAAHWSEAEKRVAASADQKPVAKRTRKDATTAVEAPAKARKAAAPRARKPG